MSWLCKLVIELFTSSLIFGAFITAYHLNMVLNLAQEGIQKSLSPYSLTCKNPTAILTPCPAVYVYYRFSRPVLELLLCKEILWHNNFINCKRIHLDFVKKCGRRESPLITPCTFCIAWHQSEETANSHQYRILVLRQCFLVHIVASCIAFFWL